MVVCVLCGQTLVAARCRDLRTVNFNGCFKLTDKCIEALVANNKQLHDVRLKRTSISDKALQQLSATGPHLRRLEVAGCKAVS